MANEMQISATLSVNKLVSYSVAKSATVTQTGSNVSIGDLLVTSASSVQVPLGSVPAVAGSIGHMHIFNASFNGSVSGTDTVDLALDSAMTQKFATVAPGELALFKPQGAAVWLKGNTAGPQTIVYAVPER